MSCPHLIRKQDRFYCSKTGDPIMDNEFFFIFCNGRYDTCTYPGTVGIQENKIGGIQGNKNGCRKILKIVFIAIAVLIGLWILMKVVFIFSLFFS